MQKNSGGMFYALVTNGPKYCASHNVSVNVNKPVYLRNHVSFFSQLLDTEIPLTLRVLKKEEEISPVSGASATSQYYQKIYDLLPTSSFQFQGHRHSVVSVVRLLLICQGIATRIILLGRKF